MYLARVGQKGPDMRYITTASGEVEAHTYEIGGICVTMSEAQAAAWNRGNVDADTMRGAYVSVPMRSGGRSYVRDGEVVVEDGQPYEDSVPLWDYIGGDAGESENYTRYMEGCEANLTRE